MPRNGRVWLATFAGLWLLFIAIAVVVGSGWPVWAAYVVGALNGMVTIVWSDFASRLPRFNRKENQ